MKIGLFGLIPFLIMAVVDLTDAAPTLEITVPHLFSDLSKTNQWFSFHTEEDIFTEIWMTGLFLSLLFIALSKEKVEDEMLTQLRLQSMLFALWCTAIVFLVETLFVFGLAYAFSLWGIIFVFLSLFILKFRYELYRLNKEQL